MKLDFYSGFHDLTILPEKSFLSAVDHQGIRLFYYPPQPETNAIGQRIKAGGWNKSQSEGESGLFRGKGSDGASRIYAYEKVRLTAEEPPYMYVWSAVPEKHLVGPANAALVRNLLLMLATTIGALFFAWGIGKKAFLTPIGKLVGMTQDFATGTLKLPIEGDKSDSELGQLTQSFYSMAEKLNTHEKQLQDSENKFRIIFDEASVGLVLADGNTGKIVFYNETLAIMLGYSKTELLGQSQAILHPPSKESINFSETFIQHQDKHQHEILETQCVTKTGQLINVAIKGSKVNIGGCQMMLGVFDDITERKQLETQQLELEEQLRQKFKMEAVGVMAGGLAHNFNNNLSIILGNVELAQMKQDPVGETFSLLKDAKIAVMRARDLVQNLLTYSRQGTHEKVPVQLSEVFEETVRLLSSTLPSSVILQPLIRAAGDSATIAADASQIQEILFNLCSNAVFAMQEKGDLSIVLDSVELKAKEIPAHFSCLPGPYAKLSIQDTGSGIAPDIIDKIFDPFFTTKAVGKGTGMGLSTVHGIVEQHGGMVVVSSILGQGTSFDLYFPAIEVEENETTLDIQERPRGTEKILFVDDEESLAEIWSQMLIQYGYKVTLMTNSREALELITANPHQFDLVITDQTMPELTGKELIEKLKNIVPDLPTIICTGFSNMISKAEARALGASAFLMKPIDIADLLQTVRQILDRKQDG